MSFTFKDAVDHVISYLGKAADKNTATYAVQAVRNANKMLAQIHSWNYLKRELRIHLNPAYRTGTISYDQTGGAEERLVTLTGGTFPSWAENGYIIIDQHSYNVDVLVDSTHLTLGVNSNPGSDVASGASFILARDFYPLPVDFQSITGLCYSDSLYAPTYQVAANWGMDRSRTGYGPARPDFYTILGDPDRMNGLAIVLTPYPDNDYQLNIVYNATPRELKIYDYHKNDVTGVEDATTISGSSTIWTEAMVGSTIRVGDPDLDTELPTGYDGLNPFIYEGIITQVDSTTSITVSPALTENFTAAPYVISDPVDLEINSMLVFFLRECERQARIVTRSIGEMTGYEEKSYIQHLDMAKDADAKCLGLRIAQAPTYRRRRLRDMQRMNTAQ